MELLMTESHMYLQDIKSSPSLTGQNNVISMSSIRLNLLTKKNLAAEILSQNPRRDTSIPSVSAGLAWGGGQGRSWWGCGQLVVLWAEILEKWARIPIFWWLLLGKPSWEKSCLLLEIVQKWPWPPPPTLGQFKGWCQHNFPPPPPNPFWTYLG